MSLSYDLTKITNVSEVCYKDGKMNPITQAIIWSAIGVQLTEITKDNYEEWFIRNKIVGRITRSGNFIPNESRSDPDLTLQEFKDHIGLKTNVFPAMTRHKWVSQYLKNIINSQAHDLMRGVVTNDKA